MSAIDVYFDRLRKQGRKAFIPFITAGDPSLELTKQLVLALQKAGSAMIELGIPYSDPIADGPVIQDSYHRALSSGVRLQEIMIAVSQLNGQLDVPLISMVSYSIIQRIGAEKFVEQSVNAGFSGSIVPDLLFEDAEKFREVCRKSDFSLIHLVTPTTPQDRMLQIAEHSTGFIYFVSVTGITGERTELPSDLLQKVEWLKQRTQIPICIGFGISSIEQVKLLGPVADGIIVGSAIVRKLAAQNDPVKAITEVEQFVSELVSALGST